MTRKRKSDHVVVLGLGDHAGAECLHCGEKLSIQLPLEIQSWIAACNSFVRIHTKCPPPPDFETTKQKELAYGHET